MAQFFDYPLNYGAGRSQYREAADNDYNTFTSETSMLLHIDTAGDGTGDARNFTDIFLKCTGVESYTIQMADPTVLLTFNPRQLPATVRNDSRDEVPIVVDGYQNDLFDLWTEQDEKFGTRKYGAKSLTLTFTAISGQTPRIYEVMVLDRLLTLDSDGGFSRIEYDSLDLGRYESDLRGQRSYVPPIGNTRDKFLVNLTLDSRRTAAGRDTIADDLIHFIRKQKSFVFAPEPKRYPERIFPAGWGDAQTAIRYISRWKGAGRRVSFSVREA